MHVIYNYETQTLILFQFYIDICNKKIIEKMNTLIRVITKLQTTEQSSKGKGAKLISMISQQTDKISQQPVT